MGLEIYVSTINNEDIKINNNSKICNKLTIINQKPNKLDNSYSLKEISNGIFINFDQKGLSKSRNLALNLANSDFVYLTDDDVILNDNISKVVLQAFEENQDADIIAFYIESIGKKVRKKVSKTYNVNYLNSMSLSSVQLVYRLSFLNENELRFDERFGAGAKYTLGEENIMLFDALKKGAVIRYVPDSIGSYYTGDSSWFKGFNGSYFISRGASFRRMFSILSPFVSLAFCIKKRKRYQDEMSIIMAYKYMLQGILNFKKKENY